MPLPYKWLKAAFVLVNIALVQTLGFVAAKVSFQLNAPGRLRCLLLAASSTPAVACVVAAAASAAAAGVAVASSCCCCRHAGRCGLLAYCVSLLLAASVAAAAATAGLALLDEERIRLRVNPLLNASVRQFVLAGDSRPLLPVLGDTQRQMRCCGADGPADYLMHGGSAAVLIRACGAQPNASALLPPAALPGCSETVEAAVQQQKLEMVNNLQILALGELAAAATALLTFCFKRDPPAYDGPLV